MEQRRSLTRPPDACSQRCACRLTAWRTADAARRCDHLDSSAAAPPPRHAPRGSLERVAAFSCCPGGVIGRKESCSVVLPGEAASPRGKPLAAHTVHTNPAVCSPRRCAAEGKIRVVF
eukprot:scaffold60497_cov78-Phaeocystis_antarctica.AAC.3